MDVINIKELKRIASSKRITKEDPYLKTYPKFIQYFREHKKLTEDNIIIGISLVYSWMPTILKNLNLESIKEATKILNKAKSDKRIDHEELKVLINTFNNSLVGTSKLLHFINPNMYAIWDSKVYISLYEKKPNQNSIKDPAKYLEYLKWIDSIKQDPAFNQFYQNMKNLLGNDITEFRAVEYPLFNKAN